MLKTEMRRVITSRFYQSLAESGVEINAIPQNQLQAIVNSLADGFVEALSSLEEEAVEELPTTSPRSTAGQSPVSGQPRPADAPVTEELLWKGRPYLSLGIHYELTNHRLRLVRGLLGRSIEEVELVRIRDTSVTQHVGERAINVGDIKIISNDPSHPEIILNNVKNPMEVRELIRQAVMAERESRGFYYREQM
jgi:hypothetical protein